MLVLCGIADGARLWLQARLYVAVRACGGATNIALALRYYRTAERMRGARATAAGMGQTECYGLYVCGLDGSSFLGPQRGAGRQSLPMCTPLQGAGSDVTCEMMSVLAAGCVRPRVCRPAHAGSNK
eukprot:846760-Prymnesium_polylepis.2